MARVPAELLLRFYRFEIPTGAINGSNTVFTIVEIPIENDAVLIYKNGLLQRQTTDYTISGTTITFVDPPAVASDLRVYYIQKTGE